MTDQQVRELLLEEAAAITAVVRRQRLESPAAMEHDEAEIVGRSAYQVGVEVGLAVAAMDGEAGRRLLDWIARNVQQSDPAALAARDRMAGNYLAALA